jgi:monomeric sarcosine oxidase
MVRSALVVGGGTMGLASAWALARAGASVTVLERFTHVHEHGSHSGLTRIIRQAYHEGEYYVPLVQRADALWVELGARTGRRVLERTGLLELGPDDDGEFRKSIEACEIHGVAHTRHAATEIMARWPFVVPATWSGCHTPSGGMLRVQQCLDALRDEAQAAGATFHYGAQVREVDVANARVTLEDTRTLTADTIVVTAGAWLPTLLPELLPQRLQRLRRVLTWWSPAARHVPTLERLPVWCAFDPDGFFYGFPYDNDGIVGLKIARHMTRDPGIDDVPIDPDAVERALRGSDLDPLQAFVDTRMPIAAGPVTAHRTCIYTMTPTSDFVVDRHPASSRIVVAGGFSGHGFKFAPAIGELVAALCSDEHREPPAAFALARHA